MKKRLSVLLIGSLVTISLAGCGGSTSGNEKSAVPQDSSVESTASGESTVDSDVSETKGNDTSKTEISEGEVSENETSDEESQEDIGPKEGDTIVDEDGNEYIYHEDSDIGVSEGEDEEPMPVTSDGQEEQPKYLDVTYTPIDVNDANVEPDVIDMSEPEYYLITNAAELSDFVEKYERTYSLNTVESGVDFNTIAEKFDDTYFEYMSVVVIPAQYDKNTESEIGTITIQGDDYVIEVCTQQADSKDQTNTVCFVVQTYKSDMQDKNVVLKVVDEDIVAEGGEEGEEDI